MATMLTATILAGSARADGDPASDVLASQALFLPWDANMSAGQQASLAGVVASAQRHDFPIHVALIASAEDLGSVSGLWRLPQQYAEFLGQELSLIYKGPLLVVMPNGFGLHGLTADTLSATLSGIHIPINGAQLAQVAIMAIDRLASATGHPLPRASASLAAIPSHGNERSAGTVSWVVFLVGCLLIAAAWTASLRVRPLRTLRGGSAAPT